MTTSARQAALQQARELAARQPVFLDTETTGIGPNDTVIEIAVIDHDGQVLVDQLVQAAGRIPPDATRVHGITQDMLQAAPRWDTAWPEIEAAIAGRNVVIYNADFDLRLLKQTHNRHWLQWRDPQDTDFVCLMKLYARYYGQWDNRRGSYRWQSLEAAGRQCGLALPNSHRARQDTLLTRALLLHLAQLPG